MSNASDDPDYAEIINMMCDDYVTLGVLFDTHSVIRLGEMVWFESDNSIPERLRGARVHTLVDMIKEFDDQFEAFTWANGRLVQYKPMNDNPEDVLVGVSQGATEETRATLKEVAEKALTLIRNYDQGTYEGAKQ